MIEDGFLRWGLTALLLAAALYAAFRAGRKSPPATRVGYGLHAAMMAAMVPMLTPGPLWPALPQILFFGLAAWWFVLRAVSRRPVPGGLPPPVVKPAQDRRAGTAGRGTLLYNGLTMAAMAYMLAAMDGQRGHGAPAGPEAAGLSGAAAAHHGGAAGVLGQGDGGVASAPGLPLPDALLGLSGQGALVLAAAFSLAAAVCAVQLLRRLRAHSGGGADMILELVGAASMAVMFAALAA